MPRINVEVSFPLCRVFGEEKMSGYSFDAEIREHANIDTFLKELGESNPSFLRMLLTPDGQWSYQIGVTLNGRKSQFLTDRQKQLQNNDHLRLALEYTGG